jgi:hypothetical protein
MATKQVMAATKPLVVYTAPGVARIADKSDGWGRLAFSSGRVPTEVLINGKQPAVTGPTMDRIAARLKALKPGRPRE